MTQDEKLRAIAKDFPTRDELIETYREVEDYIRSQDIAQKDAERILRLFRRRVKDFLKIEKLLRRVKS